MNAVAPWTSLKGVHRKGLSPTAGAWPAGHRPGDLGYVGRFSSVPKRCSEVRTGCLFRIVTETLMCIFCTPRLSGHQMPVSCEFLDSEGECHDPW